MREEMASRQSSSTVKQDLAKLNTDGDTRSIALKSLKLFVEQLNASTLPRFISQVILVSFQYPLEVSLESASSDSHIGDFERDHGVQSYYSRRVCMKLLRRIRDLVDRVEAELLQ